MFRCTLKPALVFFLFCLGSAALFPPRAAQVCDLVFQACPGDLSGRTIIVPPEVMALDARVPYCNENVTGIGDSAKAVSIVFVIDHSYSMDWTTDTGYARFKQTAAIIKSISATMPQAQVGLVVFRDDLRFDDRDSKYFKPAFPGDAAHPHDAYFPLTRLDTVFSDGRTGLDSLEEFLRVGIKRTIERISNGVPGQDYLDTTYTPYLVHETTAHLGDTTGGTNITLGFKAAKAAMLKSSVPPENRYIIFLSDGEAELPYDLQDHPELRPDLNDFEKGDGVPTTFTIFFNDPDSAQGVPPSIAAMTANIRKNNYSANNPKSDYFSTNSPSSQLLDLLKAQVLGKILVFPTRPKQAAVVSPAGTASTTTAANGDFVFAKRLPLSGADQTFRFSFTYAYTDSSKGPGNTRDTLVQASIDIRRVAGAALPAGVSAACRDQESLSLYSGGTELSAVSSVQTQLDARLTSSPGDTCKACKVEIGVTRAPPAGDRETLTLAPLGGGVAHATFTREINNAPAPGDGRLQHLAGDSIVLVYRNADVPLDTVRRAYAFTLIAPPPDTVKPPPDTAKPPPDTAKPPPDTIKTVVVPPVLQIGPLNEVARSDWPAPREPLNAGGMDWIAAGPAALPWPPAGKCCALLPGPLDTLTAHRYVGVTLEASREFRVRIKIFTNFGDFVDDLDLTLTPQAFAGLPAGGKPGTRVLSLLWAGRDRRGQRAGTGAYILRAAALIGPDGTRPGAASESTRIIGVMRGP